MTNGMQLYGEPRVDHAEGMYLWDVEGNRYLDFFGGISRSPSGTATR